MKRAWTTLRLIVATSAVATSATLPARGDYLTFDIASHEAMADYTRFESRSWAADAVGEGGRLERNTVWSGDEHVIISDIYIPSGVTLTINAGTVVKFREGTRIKVEDGGSLVINGASGNEVVLEGYDDATVFKGIVLQSSAASYSDNSFVIVRGFNFGRYATVSLNNTTAFLGGGQALVPVDVSGSRDTAFSFDWVAETNGVTFASGTMNWNRVSDGRKNITVPYPDGLPGCSNFTVRAVTLRCCYAGRGESEVKLSEFITTDIFSHEAMADYIAFESREWAAGMEGEGGRLATNATWSGKHTIVSDVYIPSGVTLTLTADTVVEFCEGTRIKIEDGGTLNIVGADGHDVILRGAEGVANFGGIVKMPNGTFTDNSYFRLEGFTYGTLANVALHDSSTFRSSGLALIPVTVSGSRSTAFSIDWVAETNGAPYKTGTLKWNNVSEGTKNISINYGAELDGYTNFMLRAAVDRACKTSPNTCTIKISDFIVSDIASHESMAEYIRFESRDWAADLEGEGGRLAANATWEGTHKIASDVYIPSGVTLTLAADAVVEFYEGTRIKIEDGGTLNIVGANGHDVIIRGAEGVTNYVGIVKMPNGTYTDNMYVQYTDKPYSAYPYITVHEATTYREAGKMWIAFSLSGTTRNQSFNVDWSTDKGDSGTLTWSSSSDGTKWIEIPIAAEPVGGTTNHVINVTAARGCNISVGTSVLTVLEPDYNAKGQVALTEGDAQSNDFAVNGGIKTQPLFLSDVEKVQYSGKWQPYDANEAAVLRVTLETDNGATVLKEASPSETGAFDLDLKQYPVGYYTLKHEILNDLGETLATMQKTFSIADDEDVVLHGGVLTSNEVWAADKVHVVYETVVVPSIYTIFIEPGAIVKFMTGTGIDISHGGAFFANRIVFTHINDDTVGGDTLNDGFTVAPPMDAYFLSGAFTFGDDTELRGITQNNALTGTIATQKTLSRGSTYRVSGTLTIASGGSLTIPPGTVLKMEDKAAIVVNSGATLNAVGTRAAPITFTSIKDDTISGDTNGDGNNTMPQPGDWVKIGVNGGIANFEFTKILYSSKNQTTGAINQNGGTVVFCNSEISHGLYDAIGVESGNFYMTNSIITDCLLAFRHWAKDPIVNSVIYDCGRLTQGGGQTFYNCVFSEIAETWEAFGFPKSTYKSCCFWNNDGSVLTGEETQDALTVCGSDGNIWGDPLFVDPANGDFRIVEGSPCVDAADGAVAPELDFYGQPRITITDHGDELVGQLADIGVCEVMPRDVVSDIDLVPQSVRTTTNAVPGQLLFVKWEIANVGGREVDAAWRDTVSLVSESGREVVLGVKTTSSRIGVGGSVFCSAYFTVPAIAEGTWYPKVNVNSYHDIFEGSLAANNALTGERAVSVGLEALDPSISREGVINGGTPTVLKLSFGENDDNRMVKFDIPAGVRVTYGFGFMPGGTRSVASGSMTASGDGVMFRVPDGATDVYVVLESDTTTTYALSTETTKLAIAGVSPATLPSSGTTTLTITGAGFGDESIVTLSGADGSYRVPTTAKDASGALVATVDCAELKAGQIYDVRVASGENAADFLEAIQVEGVAGFHRIENSLYIPASLREGRIFTGWIDFHNAGNIAAPLPLFVLESDGGVQFKPCSHTGNWRKRMVVVGTEGDDCRGISPGGSGRIYFSARAINSSGRSVKCSILDEDRSVDFSRVSNDLNFKIESIDDAQSFYGETWGDFADSVRKYLEEYPVAPFFAWSASSIARDAIQRLKNGDCAVFGRLADFNGDAIGEVVVDLIPTDRVTEDGTALAVVANREGRFIFPRVPPGEWRMSVQGWSMDGDCVFSTKNKKIVRADLDVCPGLLLNIAVPEATDPDMEAIEVEIVRKGGVERQVQSLSCARDGVLAFQSVAADEWVLQAVFNGETITKSAVIPVSENGQRETLNFSGKTTVVGIVVDEHGTPIAGCMVCGDGKTTTTDADGRFAVESFSSLMASLSFKKTGFVSFVTNVAAASEVTVSLRRGTEQSGTLLDADGCVLSNALAVFTTDGTDTYIAVSDENGRYSIDLPDGARLVGNATSQNRLACSLRMDGDSLVSPQSEKANAGIAELLWNESFLRMIAGLESPGVDYSFSDWNILQRLPAKLLQNYILTPGKNFFAPRHATVDNPWRIWENTVFSQHAKEASPDVYVTPYLSIRETLQNILEQSFADAPLEEGAKLETHTKLSYLTTKDFSNALDQYARGLFLSFGGLYAGTLEVKSVIAHERDAETMYKISTVYVAPDKYDFENGKGFPNLGLNFHVLEPPNWATPFYTELRIADTFTVMVPKTDEDAPPGKEPQSVPYTVPRSCDPNEMVGPLGVGDPETERQLVPGEWATYTIYFENQTNATAAAQEVYVSQALDANLDWSTFEMCEVAFGDQIDLGLAGKKNGTSDATMKDTNLVVRTSLALDETTGLATWYLRIVDPTTETGWPTDILAGFLPPNDPETHCGEGHLTYRVKVREDTVPGSRIDASATIVFDYNDPIITNPAWWNTVATVYKPTIDLGDGTTVEIEFVVGQPYDELPTPRARTGYTFGGWYTGPNGTGRKVTAGDIVQKGDSALHAYWVKDAPPAPTLPVTYTIQFSPNGGEGKMAAQKIAPGANAKLSANKFSKSGCVFLGWAKTKTGVVAYANGASVKNLAAAGGSVTLYAKWAVSKYSVKFNANGGKLPKGKKMAVQTMTYNKAAKLRKSVFTRKGYVFAGWATSAANAKKGVIAYLNAQSVKNLRKDGKTTTLYAVWAKPTYKVAFYANGGKGKMGVETFSYGKAKALSANKFTKKGYTFQGWATSAANAKKGKVAYKNKQKVKNLIITGKTVKLYAVWKMK